MSTKDLLCGVTWRKSSFSGGGDAGNGDCVEAAHLSDGRIALRDSKSPHTGTLVLARTGLEHLKSGQLT